MPLDVSRWLVIVAPPDADGGPDASRAIAFLAGPGQGITYHAGTWHHPLTLLDRPGRFAVFMWRDGHHDGRRVPHARDTVHGHRPGLNPRGVLLS